MKRRAFIAGMAAIPVGAKVTFEERYEAKPSGVGVYLDPDWNLEFYDFDSDELVQKRVGDMDPMAIEHALRGGYCQIFDQEDQKVEAEVYRSGNTLVDPDLFAREVAESFRQHVELAKLFS